MSLPRRLTLISGDELGQEPAGDIASLRAGHQHVASTLLPANQEVELCVRGDALELVAEFEPVKSPMLEMRVLRSPGNEEYTRIAFYAQRGLVNWDRFTSWETMPAASDSLVTLDSSYASTQGDVLSRSPETAPIYLSPNEPLKLHVFIDKSIVEVFVNGRQCVVLRVYPGREDSLGVSLRSQGCETMLRNLDAWEMKSIY
jgi:beta-fructofuranosidase